MSTVFSKNKEKRSRSSSNEANNSFVKNVTSRMSGLLPATITKWFSSPSSSNANGSTPAADATDSSTEDEAPESPITSQPPPKRMKFSGTYTPFSPSDANFVTSNIETLEQCTPYSTIQSPPGRTTFRRETNFVSTPIRAPDEESIIDRSERDSPIYKSQHSLTSVDTSVATKRKSLFDIPPESFEKACARTASNTYVDLTKPYFQPSLFCSPFYSNRTSYGGVTSMYINQPNIKQRKVAMVNQSSVSDNTTMSHSARRVMDLLENYSSPLVEAKRIAPYINMRNESCNNSTISGSPNIPKVLSYKTQELHVPSMASILRLKQRSRLMDSTNSARQIIASHSSTSEFVPYPSTNTFKEHTEKDTSKQLTTKVKSRLTRPKRGENLEFIEQPVAPINLPTAILQIDKDNLPKFTFGAPVSQPTTDAMFKTTVTTTPSLVVSVTSTITKPVDTFLSKPSLSKPEPANNDSYKFSSPVRISSDLTQISSALPKFTFVSPELGIDNPKVNNERDDKPSCFVGSSKVPETISLPKPKDWVCPDCWVSNKTDVNKCVCCGAKQPSNDPVASLKETIPLGNNINKIPTSSTDSSKWKCEDCWVSNDESINKCVCCGAKSPLVKNSTEAVKPASVVHAPGNNINATSTDNEWKCDDCWIKNKSSIDKCVACGGLRPGAKQNTTSTVGKNTFGSLLFKTSDNSLNKLVQTQNDKWECSSCLVRNDNNRSKCLCCESDKPGSVKESDKKTFNFGMSKNTTFKFGINANAPDNNPVKTIESNPIEIGKKLEESETNNNILPKAPSFTFGIPSKKPEDQIDTAKENKISEAPKINFSFGIPKKPTELVVTPVFGTANKLSESISKKDTEENEKLQEVPTVTFTLPKPKETPKPTIAFGSGLPTPNSSSNSSPTITSLLSPTSKTESKETISNKDLTSLPSATSLEAAKPQSSFTFLASGIKPAVNMFAAPSATSSSFAAAPVQKLPTTTVSLFQKPETTCTTTTLSMFQKPAVTTTSTVTLFQKPETATTAAPPSLAATAPVFSFGTNTNKAQSTSIQPEKPKFNFSFGSSTPMFNNTFGASTDNSSNANKIGITGNAFASGGNGLSASNILSSGNSITPAKIGASNDLPSNPMMGGSDLQKQATNLFGSPVQKENLWSSPNSNTPNLFVSNASSSTFQKPAAFTFGSNSSPAPSFNASSTTPFNASSTTPFNASSTTPFNASSATPFNASSTTPAAPFNASNTVSSTPFNTSIAAPAAPFNTNTTQSAPFGNNTASVPNMFGINQSQAAQPLFSSPVQNQQAPSMFGSSQPGSNPAPAIGLFGSPNVGATPAFGAPSPPMPSFEAPNPQPAFNFGASQPTGVFGFGQQPQQPQQPGMYNFGASAGGAPPVQFNMGSAPNTSVRRVRKAVRRNPQR